MGQYTKPTLSDNIVTIVLEHPTKAKPLNIRDSNISTTLGGTDREQFRYEKMTYEFTYDNHNIAEWTAIYNFLITAQQNNRSIFITYTDKWARVTDLNVLVKLSPPESVSGKVVKFTIIFTEILAYIS